MSAVGLRSRSHVWRIGQVLTSSACPKGPANLRVRVGGVSATDRARTRCAKRGAWPSGRNKWAGKACAPRRRFRRV